MPRDFPDLLDPIESTDKVESVLTVSAFLGARMPSNDSILDLVGNVEDFATGRAGGEEGDVVACISGDVAVK